MQSSPKSMGVSLLTSLVSQIVPWGEKMLNTRQNSPLQATEHLHGRPPSLVRAQCEDMMEVSGTPSSLQTSLVNGNSLIVELSETLRKKQWDAWIFLKGICNVLIFFFFLFYPSIRLTPNSRFVEKLEIREWGAAPEAAALSCRNILSHADWVQSTTANCQHR